MHVAQILYIYIYILYINIYRPYNCICHTNVCICTDETLRAAVPHMGLIITTFISNSIEIGRKQGYSKIGQAEIFGKNA